MPGLTAAEHAAVRQDQRRRRNAAARRARRAREDRSWLEALTPAERAQVLRWEALGGAVRPYAYHAHTLYEARMPGFHDASAVSVGHAMEGVAFNLATFCRSPATHGPTGAKLDRLRAALARMGVPTPDPPAAPAGTVPGGRDG